MNHILLSFMFVSLNIAFGEQHEMNNFQLPGKPRHVAPKKAPTVDVCRIKNVTTTAIEDLLGASPVICARGDKQVRLSKALLERTKGHIFLSGDPCAKGAQNEPSPMSNLEGIGEVLKFACVEELDEGIKKSVRYRPDISRVVVTASILRKLDQANVFMPYMCNPRRLHK